MELGVLSVRCLHCLPDKEYLEPPLTACNGVQFSATCRLTGYANVRMVAVVCKRGGRGAPLERLADEGHEPGGWHHRDFTAQCMRYLCPPLVLCCGSIHLPVSQIHPNSACKSGQTNSLCLAYLAYLPLPGYTAIV